MIYDILVSVLGFLVISFGFAVAIRPRRRIVHVVRRILNCTAIVASINFVSAVFVAKWQTTIDLDPLKLLIFWVAMGCGFISLGSIVAGLGLLLRPQWRKEGARLLAVSIVIPASFLLAGLLSKAIPPFGSV